MKLSFILVLALTSSVAFAADPAGIELFGTTYRVQRFDYRQQITLTDPLNPTQTIGLIECEGFHWLGNGHFLISSNEMDQYGSYANFVVEAQVVTNLAGDVTGLQCVRTLVTNDVNLLPATYDLDPSGITVGANGALVVADSENEFLRVFDFATGAILPGEFATNPPNDELEDLTFLNGEYFTVREAQPFQLDVFDVSGAFKRSILIATDLNPDIHGPAKGIAYVPDVATAPSAFHGAGGAFLLAMPDDHPGLQAITLTGAEIGWFPLTQDGTEFSNSILDSGAQQLALESVGFDPATGRLFLVQQGSGQFDDYMWVLTPTERSFGGSCAGSGGFTPKLEATGLLKANELFTIDVTEGLGGSTAVVMFGQNEVALPVNGGPCLLNVAPIVGPMLVLPLSIGGPGQGAFTLGGLVPGGVPALVHIELQAFIPDAGVPQGFSSTQGLELTTL